VSDTTTLTTVDNGAPVFGDEVAKFILPLGDGNASSNRRLQRTQKKKRRPGNTSAASTWRSTVIVARHVK
jgi:hypothetical protein